METLQWTMGDRIRKAREVRGWKQADLAVQLRVSRTTIVTWERDQHRPRRREIDDMAMVFGLSAAWLEHGTEPPDGDTASVTHRYRPFRQEHLKMAA